MRELRPRSTEPIMGAVPRVPQSKQVGAQAGAEVVAVAWSVPGLEASRSGPSPR